MIPAPSISDVPVDRPRLTAVIEQLEGALEHRSAVSGPDAFGGMEAVLGELRCRLADHVAVQEEQGYLRSVIERRPTTAPVVARLKVQRRRILEGFERLGAAHRRSPSGGLDAESLRRETKRLLDSEYITCLRNRDKFTKIEMVIAKNYHLIYRRY